MTAAFETERLRAEPLDVAEHEAELAAFHADERVTATLGGETATAEESREWIERNSGHGGEPGFGIFVFRDRGAGAFVGRGGIRRTEIGGGEEVELLYAVAGDLWGRGYGSEMAAGLVAHAERHGVRDLVAFTLPTNARSRRIMEKAGFAYERDVEHHGLAHVLYRRRTAP
ncbi:MAG TPA: GNAT family N-acetyltransferase [Gaiellaceae bacterium]|nr:GNAT family N-acetyltransferase [Gaiellaceae bacterium]